MVLDALGIGDFGVVSKGIFTDPETKSTYIVAVKVLHEGAGGDLENRRDILLDEAGIQSQFDHENVVKLIGAVTLGDPLFIAMEFCEIGSLEQYLRNHSDEGLPHAQLKKISFETALGMQYLASKRFVHRDLAARNVLLTANNTPKIADFGMSRQIGNDQYLVIDFERLPYRWMAPESLVRKEYSEKSDVWSYGVLLYEIWSLGKLPYAHLETLSEVYIAVTGGDYLEKPENCSDGIYMIMKACWLEVYLRPLFTDLIKLISDYVDHEGKGGPDFSRNASLLESVRMSRNDKVTPEALKRRLSRLEFLRRTIPEASGHSTPTILDTNPTSSTDLDWDTILNKCGDSSASSSEAINLSDENRKGFGRYFTNFLEPDVIPLKLNTIDERTEEVPATPVKRKRVAPRSTPF